MKASIKNEKEIELLRVAGKRLAHILDEVSQMIEPGVSVDALDKRVEELIREGGDTPALLGYQPWGSKRPFPAATCISINEEVVHGIPNENPRVIEDGDIVSLDCVLIHEGVYADCATSVIAGSGDAAAKKLLEVTKEALMAGIKAAKGGARVGDIGAAIEAIGNKHDYGIVYVLGGHGVGHAVHEEPFISNLGTKGEGAELIPGMVIAIEPMFTEGTDDVELSSDGYTYRTKDNSRSAHFEHSVVITDGDAEILTRL